MTKTEKSNMDTAAVLEERMRYNAMLDVVRFARCTGHNSWQHLLDIREAVQKGQLTVVETKPRSRLYDYPFENKESTSTYDRCRDITMSVDGGEPVINITIWDGDSTNGDRLDVRVTYALKGDWQALKFLRDGVEMDFNGYCLNLYDEQLRQARITAARQLGEAILAPKIPVSDYINKPKEKKDA